MIKNVVKRILMAPRVKIQLSPELVIKNTNLETLDFRAKADDLIEPLAYICIHNEIMCFFATKSIPYHPQKKLWYNDHRIERLLWLYSSDNKVSGAEIWKIIQERKDALREGGDENLNIQP